MRSYSTLADFTNCNIPGMLKLICESVLAEQNRMEVQYDMATTLRWDHVCPTLVLVTTSFRKVSVRAS